MKTKIFNKTALVEANQRAIAAGLRAIEPSRLEQMPDDMRYPVVFTLPWERPGWVRCQIGTATTPTGEDYQPVWLDVPTDLYEGMAVIDVPPAVNESGQATDDFQHRAKLAEGIANGFGFDWSLKSLEKVDSMLHAAKGWKKTSKEILANALGCYVGEVLIRETGARWCAEWLEVPADSGNITANPFMRCWKRIEDGSASGVTQWAAVLVATKNQKT